MEEIGERLARVEDRAKSNTHRIEEIEKKQDQLGDLVTNMSLIAQRQDTMERDVGEIKTDVKTLTEKPGKRWEAVAEKIVLTVVAALAAYMMGKMGI